MLFEGADLAGQVARYILSQPSERVYVNPVDPDEYDEILYYSIDALSSDSVRITLCKDQPKSISTRCILQEDYACCYINTPFMKKDSSAKMVCLRKSIKIIHRSPSFEWIQFTMGQIEDDIKNVYKHHLEQYKREVTERMQRLIENHKICSIKQMKNENDCGDDLKYNVVLYDGMPEFSYEICAVIKKHIEEFNTWRAQVKDLYVSFDDKLNQERNRTYWVSAIGGVVSIGLLGLTMLHRR